MKYLIKNSATRGKAFKVFGGMSVVRAGAEKVVDIEMDLTDAFVEKMKADGVSMELFSEDNEDTQNNDSESNDGYIVKDKGHGWFAVTLNGEEVTKGLRASDVEEFAEMTDEDKAVFVELHKAS